MSARGAWFFFPASFPVVRCLCVLAALFPWLPLADAQTGRAQTGRTTLHSTRFENLAGEIPGQEVPGRGIPRDNFRQIILKAGIIFDGTVTVIRVEPGSGNNPQTYQIVFQVRQGLRGVRTGTTVAIREWAGLWTPATSPRYHVGERAVMFLYPLSPAGLTSPVGGSKGKLPISGGQVALPAEWAADWNHDGKFPAPHPLRPPLVKTRLVPLAALVARVRQTRGE